MGRKREVSLPQLVGQQKRKKVCFVGHRDEALYSCTFGSYVCVCEEKAREENQSIHFIMTGSKS